MIYKAQGLTQWMLYAYLSIEQGCDYEKAMESTKEQSGMLHQILPPRLEDAGLEDPALPPDSIHQAFLKAAAVVKSRAASVFSSTDDNDDDGGCVSEPWPTAKDASDAVVGIESEKESPGSCIVERGSEAVADEVKVAGDTEDVVEPCVDELWGLDIKDSKKGGEVEEDDDEENKKPTLVEGFA